MKKFCIVVILSALLILGLPKNDAPVNNSTQSAKAQTVQAKLIEKQPQTKVEDKALTEPQPVVEPETANAVIAKAVEPNTPEAWMNAVGLSDTEKQAARYIIGQESGWCPTKWQGQYGACPAYHGVPQGEVGYGLCQATPASKMASAGDDWATNPITQLKWCAVHATSYGSWEKAAEFKRCTGTCYSTKVLRYVSKVTPWF